MGRVVVTRGTALHRGTGTGQNLPTLNGVVVVPGGTGLHRSWDLPSIGPGVTKSPSPGWDGSSSRHGGAHPVSGHVVQSPFPTGRSFIEACRPCASRPETGGCRPRRDSPSSRNPAGVSVGRRHHESPSLAGGLFIEAGPSFGRTATCHVAVPGATALHRGQFGVTAVARSPCRPPWRESLHRGSGAVNGVRSAVSSCRRPWWDGPSSRQCGVDDVRGAPRRSPSLTEGPSSRLRGLYCGRVLVDRRRPYGSTLH